MTFAEYLEQVARFKNRNPQLRAGQCYSNVLRGNRPDIETALKFTGFDPFFNDDLIPDALEVICNMWDRPEQS